MGCIYLHRYCNVV